LRLQVCQSVNISTSDADTDTDAGNSSWGVDLELELTEQVILKIARRQRKHAFNSFGVFQ
jgi:hypothetical protein